MQDRLRRFVAPEYIHPALKAASYATILLCLSTTFCDAGWAQPANNAAVDALKVRPIVKIPELPKNALTPADKNFGSTSIYLIDRKAKSPAEQLSRENTGKPADATFLQKLAPQPANTVIINTGDDAEGSQLAPMSGIEGTNSRSLLPAVYIEGTTPDTAQFRQIADAASSPPAFVLHVNKNRSNLYVFTSDGQTITNDVVGKGNPVVVGSKGTIISTDDNMLTLHSGKLLVESHSAPVRIGNREVGIKVEPHSQAVVQYAPGSLLRVACLRGAAGGCKVRTAAQRGTVTELSPGEEHVLDERGSNKNKIEVASYANSAGLAASGAHPSRVFAADGSELWVPEAGSLHLLAGWLFVDSPSGGIITTPLGVVKTSKRAFVNVEQVPGYFRVASCSGPDAVTMVVGNHGIPLDRGEEALFTDHTPSDAEVSAGDGILRRNVRSLKMENGMLVLDDFSIYSLLYNANQLASLRAPKTSTDKQILEELLQTIAAVQFATQDRGDYTDQLRLAGQ